MNELVVVRGGGDIASGAIQKLHRSGFDVVVLETENPSFIRRKVCFGEAVYRKEMELEGSRAVLAESVAKVREILKKGEIAVVKDPEGGCLKELSPGVVVDAILAKKNLGTHMGMAPITIGLGPGFTAGIDVDMVVETMRGHDLGRLIFQGRAEENTGIPGIVAGYGRERVIYSPEGGRIRNIRDIGDIVKKDEVIAYVGEEEVRSPLEGVLRGLIRDGYEVKKGLKIGDVDPRLEQQKNCYTISDKARNIGGSVLEGIMYLRRIKG